MKKTIILSTSTALFALSANVAHSQTAASQTNAATTAGQDEGQLAEIVVTAQRRAENLQKVPVSVSAVTADALATSGIKGLENIQVSVPALSVQNVNGYVALNLRGVGSVGNGPGFENPVALYVDGVYLANQSVGLIQFNNIERIEVLKGPQGTLFGRNATGGLVQIITRDPSRGGSMLNGSLSYGNYNAVEAQLYGATPLSDNLAADFAAHFSRHDGWGTNLVSGKEIYKNDHDVALRSKVVFRPGDLKFTLIGDYTDRKGNSPIKTTEGTAIFGGMPPVSYPNRYDARLDAEPNIAVKGGGVSLNAEIPLGDMTLTNITAWRSVTFDNTFDYDGSAFPITAVRIQQKDWQVTNETQLSSGSGDRFSWVAGLYYFRGQGSANPIAVNFATDPAFNPFFPVGTINTFGKQDTEALSGYAQGTYKLTDQLSATAGVRYSWEKRNIDARQDGTLLLPGAPVVPVLPTLRDGVTFERPTFRAALDYQLTPEVLVYASFNTGFKSGGFNVTAPADPAYRPETLRAWEIGEKGEFFDRHLRLNSAIFLYNYKDLQVNVARAAGTGFTNGASARIYGFDGEATLQVSQSLEINGGLTLLKTEFRDFPNAPIGTLGGGVPVTIGSATGNQLPFAAPTTFNLGGTYKAKINSIPLVANVSWLHSSGYFFEADNVQKQAAFDTVNASIKLTSGNGHYYVAVFGNNLLDADIAAGQVTIPSGQAVSILAAPRTYGVRLGFDF